MEDSGPRKDMQKPPEACFRGLPVGDIGLEPTTSAM